MGISIHYTGQLKAENFLIPLIEEVQDIAKAHRWKYHIFQREFPVNSFNSPSFAKEVYGISFSPPDSEPVCITFLSNGKMVSPWMVQYYQSQDEDASIPDGQSVKTHYAGSAIHKIVIHFLDHISKKYLSSFELIDEADYWQTRNEKLCDSNFDKLNGFMDQIENALHAGSMKENESVEKYFERLLKDIHKAEKDKD